MGVDARGFPGGLLGLDPAFAYVEPPSSWPLPRAGGVPHAGLQQLLNHVRLFMILQTVSHQAPPTMGILQARILEWVAILFSRGSSQPRDQTCISCIAGGFLTVWATREVHKWFLEKELLLKTKY